MNTSIFNQGVFSVCLTLLFASSGSHAEIYKWVDANGRTHYSERKEDAGKAKAVELNVGPAPKPAQAGDSPTQYWQEQETKFRQRQVQKANEKPQGTPVAATRPKSLSGGNTKWADTDEWRCNLARDVISGAVSRRTRPTDAHDIKIAEEDIRAFCH